MKSGTGSTPANFIKTTIETLKQLYPAESNQSDKTTMLLSNVMLNGKDPLNSESCI